MKHSANQTNQDVLAFLGLDAENVTAVDIELRPGEPPVVRVCQLIPGAKVVKTLHREYALIPKDEDQPLDLDALCSLARTAVSVTVDQAAKRHLKEMGEAWGDSVGQKIYNVVENWMERDLQNSLRDYYVRLYAESEFETSLKGKLK